MRTGCYNCSKAGSFCVCLAQSKWPKLIWFIWQTLSLSTRRNCFTGAYVLRERTERNGLIAFNQHFLLLLQPQILDDWQVTHCSNSVAPHHYSVCVCVCVKCLYLMCTCALMSVRPRCPQQCPCTSVCVSSYNRIWPVDRALVIQTRSSVLKGTRTKLTLAARFLALSGYMKWWVVWLPASSS